MKRSLIALLTLLPLLPLQAKTSDSQPRIISAGAGITELVLKLGSGDQLVAVDSSSRLPQGMTLPVVGYHRQLASEGLLSLKPSLLVGSDEMGPDTTLQQLQQAGVKVERLSSRADVATLQQNIDTLGALLGKSAAATELKESIDTQITRLQQGAKELNKPPRLLYLMIHPGRPAMVAGGNTAASTLITLAGGENPAASLSNYQQLNLESLLAMKPDGILVSQRSLQQDPKLLEHALPQIVNHPDLQQLPLYPVSGQALIAGLNLSTLQAAQTLQQQLLPTSQEH